MAASVAVIYTVVDGKGKQSTFSINLPSTLSLVGLTTLAQALARVIDPLLGGYISRIGLAVTVPFTLRGMRRSGSDAAPISRAVLMRLSPGPPR